MKYERFEAAITGQATAWGIHCFSADSEMYELCGQGGYDYVWLDSEHAPNSLQNIKNGIIAANSSDCAAVVRVGSCAEELIKPVVGLRPQGIIVPHIETPEQAEHVVKCCAEAKPYSRFGLDLDSAKARSKDNHPYVMLQCESVEGVRRLEEIMSVPGVDAIIIGPMDLAGSMGKLDDNKNPSVIEMIDLIAKKCSAANMPFGMSIGYDLELVKHVYNRGARLISVGQHVTYFRMMSKTVLKEMKKIEAHIFG